MAASAGLQLRASQACSDSFRSWSWQARPFPAPRQLLKSSPLCLFLRDFHPCLGPPHMQSCLLPSSFWRSLSLSYNLQHGDLLVFPLAFFSTDFFFPHKTHFLPSYLNRRQPLGSLLGSTLLFLYSTSADDLETPLGPGFPISKGRIHVYPLPCDVTQMSTGTNFGHVECWTLSFELEELLMCPIQTTV